MVIKNTDIKQIEQSNQARLRERFPGFNSPDALSAGMDKMIAGVETTMAVEAPELFDECCGPMPADDGFTYEMFNGHRVRQAFEFKSPNGTGSHGMDRMTLLSDCGEIECEVEVYWATDESAEFGVTVNNIRVPADQGSGELAKSYVKWLYKNGAEDEAAEAVAKRLGIGG